MYYVMNRLKSGPQPADIFGRGQNDCNVLFYLTSKQFLVF